MNEANELPTAIDQIGARLRQERIGAGISQRELARRVGLSPSLISQLESGQSKPSVGTLYAIVTELGLSLDRIIRADDIPPGRTSAINNAGARSPVVHPGERQAIELDSGVRWEDLTPETEAGIDFLHAIYEVGGASTADETLMRQHGREYGYVISGTLGVQIKFDEFRLGPGDAIAFDSSEPHRLFNDGDVPVHAIWFVVGRDSDGRKGLHRPREA